MFMHRERQQKGFGVVEIIVGASVISIALFGLVSTFQNSLRISRETGRIIEARFLMEEGLEAMRIMRDGGWSNVGSLATSSPIYLVFSGGTWATTSTQTFIGGTFLRSVVVEDVRRDGNDDIASAGSLDPNVKKVTVSVSWFGRSATTTESAATYLVNIF